MSLKSLVPSTQSAPKRKADVTMRLSEFEIPPMQDVLLVGKRAPIGPESIRRMVTALSPDQYEVIQLEHDIFEAVVLKKALLKLLPEEELLPMVQEEGARIATDKMVMKAQVNIVVEVNRVVDL
ncbi:MAG: hypothetical protein AB1331_06100 [Bacillota bacterium]